MPINVPWTRLIRFESEEDANIHYGEPIISTSQSNLGQWRKLQPLKAKKITGNPLDSSCIITDIVLTVRRLLAPLARQDISAIRCIGGNYRTHLDELNIPPPAFPCMFPKFPNSIVGPGENIEIPKIAQDDQADYEGELVIVIGKEAKNVLVEDAYDYIAGYTVGNDMSARKWQGNFTSNCIPPPQAGFSKAFDSFCPIGPCITAAHLVPDPQALSLRTWVNGELRQDSNTSYMLFNVAQIIQFLSQGTTLYAGDVILTGTPSGPGFTMRPPKWLQHGDKIEIRIGNLGTLVNSVTYA
ncbi:uncharacterized protein Triagg1_10908 [Trichoderma aggressivum f. europaeum]|uniref:Fumarylacetoacetase-like C-terminal domain-containing protein n=1 Tax=Trichoderma aggressivum f. europaeum TaxID=173218 RepID=A0AAE1I527_9HYPO|nr:hypothetical protein Triagg1_10908 [Trichoderma aggressivum f. europaeum]